MFGTGNDGVARVWFNEDELFGFDFLYCDKIGSDYHFVSGNLQGDNIISLPDMPCREESTTEGQVSNIGTTLQNKFAEVGEELDEVNSVPRTNFGNVDVTLVCEI